MRKLLIIIFLLFLIGIVQSSTIANSWLYATILIENEWGRSGTGFLVARYISEDKARIFLCTNKHVIHKDESMRDKAQYLNLSLNVEKEGMIVGKTYKISLFDTDGKRIWREHPDDNVDVLVVDVTFLINTVPNIVKKWADYSLIADKKLLAEKEITIGDDILILGYPLHYKQGNTNMPIVRQGIIASQIGAEYIEEQLNEQGKLTKRRYRGFLIDGGIIPGSSGSPVVLKPVTGRVINDTIQLEVPPPYLLGIVSETRHAPVKTRSGNILSFAGMGLAYDAVTIKETIELFFQNTNYPAD